MRQRRLVAVRPAARSGRLGVRSGAGETRCRSPRFCCFAIMDRRRSLVEAALQDTSGNATPLPAPGNTDPCAFEQLFMSLVAQADTRLWSGLDARVGDNLNEAARASLRLALLRELSSLGTAALYERFAKARNASSPQHDAAGRRSTTARRATIARRRDASRRLAAAVRRQAGAVAACSRPSRGSGLIPRAKWSCVSMPILRRSVGIFSIPVMPAVLPDSKVTFPIRTMKAARSGSSASRTARGSSTSRRICGSMPLVRVGRTLERRASPDRAQSRGARSRRTATAGPNSSITRRAPTSGFRAVFPACRRLAGAVSLLCLDRHASGEHDRLRRSPGAIDLEMILQAGAEERSAEAPEDFAFAAAAEIVSIPSRR